MKIQEITSFSDLQKLFETAEVHVSFLGKRSISIDGDDGPLPIDALQKRIDELAERNNYEFTSEERKIGKALIEKVGHLYDQGDEVVARSNCITRLFACLRINSIMYTPEWLWRIGLYHSPFDYYTAQQFQKGFGMPPQDAIELGAKITNISSSDKPARWSKPDEAFNPSCLDRIGKRFEKTLQFFTLQNDSSHLEWRDESVSV